MTIPYKHRLFQGVSLSFKKIPWRLCAVLTLLSITQAYAIGDSELKEQVSAVDSALKSIAHPALWAIIIYIGGMSLVKQNLVGVGIAGAGAVALSQISGWIQQQFTMIL